MIQKPKQLVEINHNVQRLESTKHLFAAREMKFKALIIIAAVLIFFSTSTKAQKAFPRPMGLVNDFAGVISSEYEKKLLKLSTELLRKTGVPILFVSMPDIGGEEYNSYSVRLYNKWGGALPVC